MYKLIEYELKKKSKTHILTKHQNGTFGIPTHKG